MGIILMYGIRNDGLLNLLTILSWLFFGFLFFANLLYKKYLLSHIKGFLGLANYLFWLAFGALSCGANQQPLEKKDLQLTANSYLKAWIGNEPQIKNGIMRLELNLIAKLTPLQTHQITGKILMAMKLDAKNSLHLNYGDECIFTGACTETTPPQNPGEFDFKSWLNSKKIAYQIFVDQQQLIKLPSNAGNPIIRYAISVRKQQVDTYRKLIKNDQAFAVASTLVLGYRADLSKETLAAYSKTGTIHALSVSGAHVGIIFLFLNWMLFFLNRYPISKLLIICLVIWYYSLLTGFSPSVLRSAIMLTVYLTAKTFNKNTNSYNILAFTAFCLLAYDPFLIWDVGFQLSFLAVFGLIYLQPKIYKLLYIKNKIADNLWSTVALSLAAQFTTFPLSIYYFHQFPVYFIISNIFILLPLSAMMYLGIIILVLKAHFLAPVFEWVITFTNSGLAWIASIPFSGISGIWITPWQLALLILLLSFLTFALVNFHKKMLYAGLGALLCFQILGSYQQLTHLRQRKILFFSLRKHYAAAFINGNSAVLLSDVTPSDPDFEFSLKPALDQLQIDKIDHVSWEKDTIVGQFIKKNHQVRFFRFNSLLIDRSFNNKKILGLPKFDALWIHHSPKTNLIDLRKEVLFSKLLIDATNTTYAIKKYEQQSQQISVPLHVLKKNISYLIDLNLPNHE